MVLMHVFLNNYIDDDTAKFYAPMARAFAAGNYERAFYPTIPPLMPVLGGLKAKLISFDGFNCLMVPPKDPIQLAEAIKKCLKDHSLRGRLRENALKTASSFSWEKSAAALKAIIMHNVNRRSHF